MTALSWKSYVSLGRRCCLLLQVAAAVAVCDWCCCHGGASGNSNSCTERRRRKGGGAQQTSMRCGGSSRERRVPTRTMDGRANMGRAPSGVPGAGQLSTELPESAGTSWQGPAAGDALLASAAVQASATARNGVS